MRQLKLVANKGEREALYPIALVDAETGQLIDGVCDVTVVSELNSLPQVIVRFTAPSILIDFGEESGK